MATQPDVPDGSTPELSEYFADAIQMRDPELRIYALNTDESRQVTQALSEFDVGEALGLIALDNANDSNPYCYISKGLAQGMILHLNHDAEPYLAFRSLKAFRAALKSAIAQRCDIDDLQAEAMEPVDRQDELVTLLTEAAERNDDFSVFLACTFLPLLDPSDADALELLGSHQNFFLREAAAVFVSNHPLNLHRSLAERLAKDRYEQVARPAGVALKAMRSNEHRR